MAKSTGPILAIGGITLANRVVFHSEPMDWRIPIATGLTAVLFSMAETVWPKGITAIAYLALVTVVLARTDPKVPSPAESALEWYRNLSK